MKIKCYIQGWLLLSCGLAGAILRAQDKPVDHALFKGSVHAINEMVLSPDGEKVAYISGNEAYHETLTYILDLKTGEATGVEAPRGWPFFTVSWINEHRLLASYYGGYVAVNDDGKNYLQVSTSSGWLGSVLHTFPPESRKLQRVLFQNDYFPSELMNADDAGYARPNVLSINIVNGRYEVIDRNPDDVLQWYADRNGQVLLARTVGAGRVGLRYRPAEAAPWQPVPKWSGAMDERRVLGLDDTGTKFFVVEDVSIDETALRLYDATSGERVQELLTIKRGFISALILAPDYHVIGVRCLESRWRTVWFDEKYGRIQHKLDAQLPGMEVKFINSSADESKLLFLARNAQQPGTYYLYDAKQGTLAKLVDRDDSIPLDRLSKQLAVNFKARDGLTLPGYLILPVGRPAKDLPLVVMVHDGPWQRDADGFDRNEQFLAARGYAILKVNYRGSYGYSYAFYHAGFQQLDTGILNDIADATQSALLSGAFDPKRVAIMGEGFGGYCAFMEAIRHPGLFACGVSVNGVIDWSKLIKPSDPNNPEITNFDPERVGDPKANPERIAQMTPMELADQVHIPFLIAEDGGGTRDRVSTSKMKRALQKAGVEVDYVTGPSGFSLLIDGGEKLYTATADFLDRHLR